MDIVELCKCLRSMLNGAGGRVEDEDLTIPTPELAIERTVLAEPGKIANASFTNGDRRHYPSAIAATDALERYTVAAWES